MSRSIGRIIIPAAASFLAPGIGTALGLSGTLGSVAGGAIAGGLGSALTGGKPLQGALTGGLGGALSGALGTAAGTPLANAAGPTQGSGILGSVTRGLSDTGVGRALTSIGNVGGGSSMFGSSGGSSMFSGGNLLKALGGVRDYMGQSDMEKQLLRANEQAQAQLAPYAQTGTAANRAYQELLGLQGDPQAALSAITSSPDYQFRFGQGQNALNANLAATGQLDSGAAMKAAQEYGQGLASQAYQDRIGNLSNAAGFGANASGGLAQLLSGRGDIRANRIAGQSIVLNQAISGLTGGNVPSIQDILKQMGYA